MKGHMVLKHIGDSIYTTHIDISKREKLDDPRERTRYNICQITVHIILDGEQTWGSDVFQLTIQYTYDSNS